MSETLNLSLNNLIFFSGWQMPLCLFCSWLATSPCLPSTATSASSSSPHLQIPELSALCWHLVKEHSRSLPRHYIEPGSCAPLGTRPSTASTETCSEMWPCPSLGQGPNWENILVQVPIYAKANLHKYNGNKRAFMWNLYNLCLLESYFTEKKNQRDSKIKHF